MVKKQMEEQEMRQVRPKHNCSESPNVLPKFHLSVITRLDNWTCQVPLYRQNGILLFKLMSMQKKNPFTTPKHLAFTVTLTFEWATWMFYDSWYSFVACHIKAIWNTLICMHLRPLNMRFNYVLWAHKACCFVMVN